MKKMTKDFKTKLSGLLSLIEKTFTYINCGGCAEFAHMFGRKLEAAGYDVKVLSFETWVSKDIIESKQNLFRDNCGDINQLNRLDIGVSHVTLLVDGCVIDSTGIYSSIEKYVKEKHALVLIGEIDLNTLHKWCDEGRWNSMFDVGQLPNMRIMMNTYFDKHLTMMDRFDAYVKYKSTNLPEMNSVTEPLPEVEIY